MALDEPTAKPLSARDAAGLLGVLSVLESHSESGHLHDDLAHALKLRLQRDGQIGSPHLGQADLRSALSHLNQRLRIALGEDQ
jgi:hypothetical protein